MSNTDPGWCHEHKSWMPACERERHRWESLEHYKERVEVHAHPECPSCQCPNQRPYWPWPR